MKKLILLLSVLLFSLEFVAAQDEYERSVFVSSSGVNEGGEEISAGPVPAWSR